MKLSILIPATPDRNSFLAKLIQQFNNQLGYGEHSHLAIHQGIGMHYEKMKYNKVGVEVLICYDDFQNSIGFKRNCLMHIAAGEYIAFIDSDDRIGEKYFAHAFKGIEQGVDACGLTGIITEDGQNPKKFVHSMRYDSWYEKDGVYYRNNNHLNVVKASIAKQMRFPETSQGEDHSYSKQLLASALIKTEYWDENEILYYYDYRSKK